MLAWVGGCLIQSREAGKPSPLYEICGAVAGELEPYLFTRYVCGGGVGQERLEPSHFTRRG